MSKYLAAVDHMAHYNKDRTYIRVNSGSKMLAFVEAATKGFQRSDVSCVVILKQITDCKYQITARIYPSGVVEELAGVCDETWTIYDFEIDD